VWFSRRLAFALIALALTACGALPRPFQPDDKSLENPLLVMPDRGGIVVLPLAGAENDLQSMAFAEEMAKALRDADVAAHTGTGNRASLTLSSFLERKPDGSAMVVLWLASPQREDLGTFEAAVVPRDVLTPSPRRAEIAAHLARAIAARFHAGGRAPTPVAARPRIHIEHIADAPGDSGVILTRALAAVLRREQVEIVPESGPSVVTVRGTLRFEDKPRDTVGIEIVWRVFAADGRELGKLDQGNDIPAEVLKRAWPEIATAIADNAAQGILDILERVRRERS
jgi:hypothetical protein